jgi:hypothetical protein
VKKAEQLEFSSDMLYRFINCARTLISLRQALISEQWTRLNEIVSDVKTSQVLDVIPAAVNELGCVKQESHNYQVIDIIEKALQPRPKDETDYEHLYLVRAIETAQAAVVTSVIAKQLLECAKNVLLLRTGLSSQNSKQVGVSLRWFKLYSQQCPAGVQQEFQRAYIMHQKVQWPENKGRGIWTLNHVQGKQCEVRLQFCKCSEHFEPPLIHRTLIQRNIHRIV